MDNQFDLEVFYLWLIYWDSTCCIQCLPFINFKFNCQTILRIISFETFAKQEEINLFLIYQFQNQIKISYIILVIKLSIARKKSTDYKVDIIIIYHALLGLQHYCQKQITTIMGFMFHTKYEYYCKFNSNKCLSDAI